MFEYTIAPFHLNSVTSELGIQPVSKAREFSGKPSIAVLIPCFNEAKTIGEVINSFRKELPTARIIVFDNNSTDGTDSLAREAGAEVRYEKRQGKGFVVRQMFSNIDADICVMVDGDSTYPANRVHHMLEPILEGKADMVVGNRLTNYTEKSFRPLHVFGNLLVVYCIRLIFGQSVNDVMSGYRTYTSEVVRQLPVISRGFEIETEITLQALFRDFVIAEIPIPYGERPDGSFSKLRTFSDGFLVLRLIGSMCASYRPLFFFSLIGGLIALTGLGFGIIPIMEFAETGKVERFPTAILAASLEIISLICFSMGMMLDVKPREIINL